MLEQGRRFGEGPPVKTDQFTMPPVSTDEQGNTRTVGFELEFAAVELPELAKAVAELYQGQVHKDNSFIYVVKDTGLGDFRMEVDSSMLQGDKYGQWLESLGIPFSDSIEEFLDQLFMDAAAAVAVPFELVSPPLPLDRLSTLFDLEKLLRKHSAQGTRASWMNAFGMQFNPQAPALSPESIVAHLRAFFLLLPWLKDQIRVNLSRRIVPYIHDFPRDYVQLVVDPEYRPDLGSLVGDYISHNPTRNRPLDLLPLFTHLKGRDILEQVEEPHLVKPRPTYHYRLPDCRIDEEDWSSALEWNRWVKVEELAQNSKAQADLGREYLAHGDDHDYWLERLGDWMGL